MWIDPLIPYIPFLGLAGAWLFAIIVLRLGRWQTWPERIVLAKDPRGPSFLVVRRWRGHPRVRGKPWMRDRMEWWYASLAAALVYTLLIARAGHLFGS